MSGPLHVLCLNCGSSSLKLALYGLEGEREALRLGGAVEGVGPRRGRLRLEAPGGAVVAEETGDFASHRAGVEALLALLRDRVPVDAVGHRVVHGGPERDAPARIDAALLAELRNRIPLAPLHLPPEIETIEAVTTRLPAVPQVACFDTAFHRRMPEIAQRLPLPRVLWERGMRRYGFHGLSYEFVLRELGEELGPRTVIAHLGNGSSLAAVRCGEPVDTTMGFTPTGGVMMGTRSGDLDPEVLLHLMREGWDAGRLATLVTREAGLLGVSDLSSDMRELLALRESEPHAAEAIAMFCYHVRKQIGALAAVLGGLDLLVFTGGIGERSASVRREICQGLEHLGVVLADTPRAGRLSREDAPCTVRVVATNENLMIARHTRDVVREGLEAG
jgi:acetate kinase